jgi:hypothetical protein
MSIDLNKVYALGMEKFAGDQKLAVEFVEGFAKEAQASFDFGDNKAWRAVKGAFSSSTEGARGFVPAIMEGAGKGIGGALVSGAVGLIGSAAVSIGNGNLHNQFMVALEKAIQSNPILKNAKREKVLQYAETIFKFSPHVATDTNVLSSILANAIHGEGLDPMTIKSIVDLEGKFKDNTGFSPKSYV